MKHIIPTFETERLILRAPTLEDAPSAQKYFADFDVVKQIANVPWPYPEKGVETYWREQLFPKLGKTELCWGIFLKTNLAELIGLIALHREGMYNRGFWLGKPFWGNGYMTEAVIPVMDYAFTDGGFERMVIGNSIENAKSRAVKERTGAIFLGYRDLPEGYYKNTDVTQNEDYLYTKHSWLKYRAGDNVIPFCGADGAAHDFLSNMYLAEMVVDGEIWPSAEHYYQAQKFRAVPEVYQQIRCAETGHEARAIAQKYKQQRRADWDEVKQQLLYDTMLLKFSENGEMKTNLLATGTAYLEKAVPDDPFWGVLPDGTGQNMMGLMLMKIRTTL